LWGPPRSPEREKGRKKAEKEEKKKKSKREKMNILWEGKMMCGGRHEVIPFPPPVDVTPLVLASREEYHLSRIY